MQNHTSKLNSLARQLNRKMLWLSLIGVTGLAGVFILSLVVILQQNYQQLRQASANALETFDLFFLELKSDLLATSASLDTSNNVNNLLRKMRMRNRNVLQVQLLNQDGKAIASTGFGQQQPIQIPELAWLSIRGQVGQIYISPLQLDANTTYVDMATVVTNNLGISQDLLVIRVDLTELWRQTIEQQVSQTGYVYILDKQGRILAANNLHRLGEEIKYNHEIREHLANVHIHTGFDGQLVLALADSLNLVPWYAIIEQPISEAIEPFIWPAGIVFTVLLAGAVVMIGIVRFTQERIVVPLGKLHQGVIDLSNGKLTQLVQIEQNDELGYLASAFNSMAAQLKASLEDLERRVKERTLQLETTNQVLEKEVIKHQETSTSLKQALQKLSFHFNNSPLAVVEWDRELKVQNWSEQAEAIFGWTAPEVMGKSWPDWRFVFTEDLAQFQAITSSLVNRLKPRNKLQCRNYGKNGRIMYCEWYNSALFDTSGQLISILSLVLDVSERKLAEVQLQNLIVGTAATTGQDFFPALVSHIAEALHVSYAIVTEKVDNQLQALAFWANGNLQPTFSYHPAKTPCKRTLQEEIFYCASMVQQMFPDDLDLVEMEAESYLGVALLDSHDQAIGNLCILHQEPIQDPQRAEQILQVFAARAAAELERQRATTLLEQLNQELESKVAERTAALKERETRYRALMEGASDGIMLLDGQGNLLEANPKSEAMFGYTCAELTSMHFTQLHQPEELPSILKTFEKVANQGLSKVLDVNFRCQDGQLVPVDISASVIEIQGEKIIQAILRDISDRKAAEKALKIIQSAVDLAAEGTFLVHPDASFYYVNDAACSMLGYSREELLNLSVLDINPDFSPERWLEHWQKLKQQHNITIETRHQARDGRIYPVEISINYLELYGEEYNFAFVRDISEREYAQEQIRRYTAQLEASNQELEVFAYSVSHDLRAPLRAIDGFSQALLEDYGESFDGQARDYFARIRKNVSRMAMLIDDLLRLSRVSRSEIRYTRVNLSALAQELIDELLASEPERQVEFVSVPEAIVWADATLMRVLLTNLLANAWKFTSHHQRACIEFGMVNQEGQPTYFVRDDGAGFDMNYAKMLFGVFQRLHSTDEFPGSGIGLATVQRAIHRHGGKVWAEAAIEQGATFYFTLPRKSMAVRTGK